MQRRHPSGSSRGTAGRLLGVYAATQGSSQTKIKSTVCQQSVSVWSACHSPAAPSQPLGTKGNMRQFSKVTVDSLQQWIIILLQVQPLLFLLPDLQGRLGTVSLHCF